MKNVRPLLFAASALFLIALCFGNWQTTSTSSTHDQAAGIVFHAATPTLAADMSMYDHPAIATDRSAVFQTDSGANDVSLSCTTSGNNIANLNCTAGRTDQTTHPVFAVMKIGDQCCANGNCHAASKNANWEQVFANSQHAGTAFIPTSSALYSRWMNSASARTAHVWTATDDIGAKTSTCAIIQTDQTGRYLFDQTAGCFQSVSSKSCATSSSGALTLNTNCINSSGIPGDYDGLGFSQAQTSSADYGQCMVLTSSSFGCSKAYTTIAGKAETNFQRAG